jgi:hypothetical protein
MENWRRHPLDVASAAGKMAKLAKAARWGIGRLENSSIMFPMHANRAVVDAAGPARGFCRRSSFVAKRIFGDKTPRLRSCAADCARIVMARLHLRSGALA